MLHYRLAYISSRETTVTNIDAIVAGAYKAVILKPRHGVEELYHLVVTHIVNHSPFRNR